MSEEKPKPAATPHATSATTSPENRPSQGTHWLPIFFALLALAVVGFIVYRLVTQKPKKAPPAPPVRVSVTNATQGNIGVYVSALGTVTPIATVSVVSQVTGQLTNVNFVEGQIVKTGDLLAVIDERPFQALLASDEGLLERDQALLEEARMDLKRYESASAQKAVPRQQYEDQLALVHQDEGIVKNDQGMVDNAKVQLGFCRIGSPITGRVGLRNVDPGNVVLSGSTNGIAVLTQLQPITIIFSVAEDFLPQIRHQMDAGNKLRVDAYDRSLQTKLATGNIMALDSQIDVTTGTIRLRSVFTNEDNALFPNQFVNVSLLLDTLTNKTLIPSYAVQRNVQAAYAYVVKSDETVEMRSITTDATDGNVTAVEGLNPGETIVTDNFNRLTDGAKVSVRQPNEGGEKKNGPAGENKPGGNKGGEGKKRKSGGTNKPAGGKEQEP